MKEKSSNDSQLTVFKIQIQMDVPATKSYNIYDC